MKKGPLVLIIIIILVALFLVFGRKPSTTTQMPENINQSDNMGMDMTPTTPPASPGNPNGTVTAPNVVTFDINGGNFYFTPKTMTVKKGDTVVVNFKNDGGTHNFMIKEFNVATKTIQSGQTDTVQFVASKAGSFTYYCSIGTHQQMGMWGTLTVTE